jgi:hypothetical protein
MANKIDRETLAAALERHVKEEDEILLEYRKLSDRLSGRLPQSSLSVLVDHIVTEEEMHHFLLRTLGDWLRTPPSPGASLESQGLDREAILRDTRALKEHEKKTVAECRDLVARLSGDEGEIFETVLEAIALDSEKHHRLLAAVEKLIA